MADNKPLLLTLSPKQRAKLEHYVHLLEKWNRTINLIGKSTINDVWQRHIEDSLQLANQFGMLETVADMGSGGGLPGIVIAIIHPETMCYLIEQDDRKAAFLQECVARLELANATVINKNIKTVATRYNAITARALAPLSDLFALAYPRLEPDAFCLFPKGQNFSNEVEEAIKEWSFTYQVIPSKTEEKAAILRIDQLTPRKGSL